MLWSKRNTAVGSCYHEQGGRAQFLTHRMNGFILIHSDVFQLPFLDSYPGRTGKREEKEVSSEREESTGKLARGHLV
jgi:hypothetical protein